MRLSCACGIHGSYELFAHDVDARHCFALALSVPAPLGPLLLDYMTLFRPGKQALGWRRVRGLLTPLVECIKAGQVQRHGRAWPAPLPAWQAAIEQMLATKATLTLPLKNHHYLFAIVAGGANSAEAKAEEQQEQQRREAASARQRPREAAVQQLGDIASHAGASPQARAVAALATEIARRREAGEPSMTHREMADWQKRKQNEFETQSNQD